MLLVSHDRDFLDRVVTSVIAGEGNGRVGRGGYTDMLAQRAAASRGLPPAKARRLKQSPAGYAEQQVTSRLTNDF